MKKAKALQDFWYGSEKISKGDVLEDMHPASLWHYRVGTIRVPSYIIENNPHIFECHYEEKLTSEQWDEKARGYGYWIPMDGEEYYIAHILQKTIDSFIWRNRVVDISCLRAGLAFETHEEAEELLKKLKKEKPL